MGAQLCSQTGKWKPRACSLDQGCKKQVGSGLSLGPQFSHPQVRLVQPAC